MKKSILCLLSLLLCTSAMAQNQTPEQKQICISTHISQFYGPSSLVKVVTIDRLRQWSTWCDYGYNAKKINDEIRPCYEKAVDSLRAQHDGYLAIKYQQSIEIKEQCTKEIWQSISSKDDLAYTTLN